MSWWLIWMLASHPSAIPFEVSLLVYRGITVAVLRKRSWWKGLLLIASQVVFVLWTKEQVENYVPVKTYSVEELVMGYKLIPCYILLALTTFSYAMSMLNLWCSTPVVKKTESA